MLSIPFPESDFDFVLNQTELVLSSYRRWMSRELIPPQDNPYEQAQALFDAPIVVAASDNAEEPRLIYGNRKALELWELSWREFIQLPARQTAESVEQEARDKFLDEVRRNGYIVDYSGVRISSTGRRFWIRQARVWNLLDDQEQYRGQAVAFDRWDFL